MIVVALFACGEVAAHGQSVRGRVTDASTGTAIASARVSIVDADSVIAQVTTDAEGVFHLVAPRAGRYRLRAESFAFRQYLSDVVRLTSGSTAIIDIKLEPAAVLLDSLSVAVVRERGSDAFERRRENGTGTFFDGIDIALRGDRALDLLSTARGFTLDIDRRLRPFHSRGCLAVFLDDIPDPIHFSYGERGHSRQSRVGASFEPPPVRLAFGGLYQDLDILLSSVHIRGVEMYRSISDVPLEIRNSVRQRALRPIGHQGGCGAVIIWTDRAW
jgi:hypothetical protein